MSDYAAELQRAREAFMDKYVGRWFMDDASMVAEASAALADLEALTAAVAVVKFLDVTLHSQAELDALVVGSRQRAEELAAGARN